MISRPSLSDIPALKTMWKFCFPKDTPQFIDFYFAKIFNPNRSLGLWKNGALVAAMQILPYQIKTGDKIYDAAYISGAVTHPSHRQKGYMQELLLAAFEEMKQKNYTFSFLIPQEDKLFDYYAKYGYEKAFPKSTQTIRLEENKIDYNCVEIYRDFKNLPVNEIYRLYLSLLHQKENAVLKSREQFELILEDLFIDKGCCFYIKNKSIACVIVEEGNVLIKELFDMENGSAQLFAAIKDIYQTNYIILQNNNQINGFNQYYGMIKVLDDSKFNQPAVTKDFYMSMMMD